MRAQQAALRRGVDISGQAARKVELEDFDTFDLVLAMDASNIADLHDIAPHAARKKIRRFLDYAPHLGTVSEVHGEHIYEIGYHVLPYFLHHWERYKDVPLGVLAHSTHVRGPGRMEDGVEKPSFDVTLSTQIPPEDCAQLALGYRDPDDVDVDQWKNRESEGVLLVPKAGEMLYRIR
jgi:protein-tyrosine-phosphatase